MFKNKTRLGNNFHFIGRIEKSCASGVAYKWVWILQWILCATYVNVKIGEHIGIWPFTGKQVKLKNSLVADHLLLCNHSAFYDDFSILTLEDKRFSLELNKNLLIMRDKPSLNMDIIWALLCIIDRP